MLDLSPFAKALDQLEDALAYAHSPLAKSDPKLALHLRAGAIQAFEFSYELSVKMLKRFLEATETDPSAIDGLSFQDVMRLGFERGLLRSEVSVWKMFRQERGTTSHSYDEAKAQEIFSGLEEFLAEARALLGQLQQRQA